MCGVLRVLYLQTAVDAVNMLILFTKKPEDPQFEPYARIKMAQVLGSLVFICGYDKNIGQTLVFILIHIRSD